MNLKKYILGFGCILVSLNSFADNPEASPDAMIVRGNVRFTILTPEMIRIEYSPIGVFEDRATFMAQNRDFGDVPAYTLKEEDGFMHLDTEKLKLWYRLGTNPYHSMGSPYNLTITLNVDGENVVWYPGKEDKLNLKGTTRTLDICDGDSKRGQLEEGVISRSGWAVINDSPDNVREDGSYSFPMEYNEEVGYDWWALPKHPHNKDYYFFGYGKDYKRAISDYIKLSGKIPLPPDYIFGYWYSKYSSYSADDYLQIMKDIRDNEIPADVMILDMDWHWNGSAESESEGIGGWTGWSWNTNLIPDPEGLLKDIHANNFKTAMNLHPADGINRIESPQYFQQMNSDLAGKYSDGNSIAWCLDFPDFTNSFFNTVIRDHEKEGVDFWWLDWQQHLTSPYTDRLGETFWCNHVFFNDMKKNRPEHRPVIFHRWGGLGSHRYQIGFSGDALINFPTLAFEPYFTSAASNVGYTYWGHDLGGHAYTSDDIVNDPELLLRWIQFGVFTPIFRTHATKDEIIERRIWKYDNFADILAAIRLRYDLFPYLYTMARETYDTGIGMVRPLYYEYPNDKEAYDYEGEYFFGDDILVAPVTEASKNGSTTPKEVWFPEGCWWSPAKNKFIQGPCIETIDFALNEIPYFYRQGSVIPLNPPTVKTMTERPEHMILNVVAGRDGEFSLYEDSGDNSDYDTVYATTALLHTVKDNQEIIRILPREGSEIGLAKKRSWNVNVYGVEKPENISLDGKKLSSKRWVYNPDQHCVSLLLPTKNCNKESNITLSF